MSEKPTREPTQDEDDLSFEKLKKEFQELAEYDIGEEERKEIAERAYEDTVEMLQDLGYEHHEDVNDIYKELRKKGGGGYYARRHSPNRLIEGLALDEGVEIKLDPDHKDGRYTNAVKLKPVHSAMKTAFTEGVGGKEISSVMIFNGDNVEIEDTSRMRKKKGKGIHDIPDSDTSTYRSIEGEVPPEDIDYIVLRVPSKFVPEEKRTEKDWKLIEKKNNNNSDTRTGRNKSDQKEPITHLFRGFKRVD